jgi:hypothetical protein
METRPVSYLTEVLSRLLAIFPMRRFYRRFGRQTERAVTLQRTDEIMLVAINLCKPRK